MILFYQINIILYFERQKKHACNIIKLRRALFLYSHVLTLYNFTYIILIIIIKII